MLLKRGWAVSAEMTRSSRNVASARAGDSVSSVIYSKLQLVHLTAEHWIEMFKVSHRRWCFTLGSSWQSTQDSGCWTPLSACLICGTWGIIHGGNCQVWNWDTTDRSRLLEAATSWLAGYIYPKFSGEYRVKWRVELVSERTYSIIKVYVCYVEEHWGYHWKKTLKLESRISILSWTLYHDAHWLVLVCT